MQKEETKPGFIPSIMTIVLFIIMLVIPIVFFVLLDNVTNAGFGIKEILFSIAFAIATTLFLTWIKSFMKNRPYLGLIIGLIILVSFEYSIFLKYIGPYTTTFAIITGLIILIYFGYYFLKFKKENNIPEGFDDSLSTPKK